jgi:hypothetical protein
VETLLLDDLTKTWNIVSYFIRNGKVGFGLECWNHVDESWFKIGIKNIKNFLIFNWMIDWKIKQENLSLKTFEFFQEIIPQTDNFRWVKDFSGFTEIKENETYAIDWEKEVKNTYWKNIYVWIPTKNLKKWDGSGFLFKEIDSELAMITLDTKQILMMLNIWWSDYHWKSKSIPEHIDIFPWTFGLTELEFDKIYSLIK